MRGRSLASALLLGVVLGGGRLPATAAAGEHAAVIVAKPASFAETLAAREVRRYVYLRTGRLLPIVTLAGADRSAQGGWIVVARKDRHVVKAINADVPELRRPLAELAAQGYLLRTVRWSDRPVLLIAGGDGLGTLYGAYRLAEHLGVRFYLHGDVVPDHQAELKLPTLDEQGKPLFRLRGIQPFHDFPEGPDWWSLDDYKAVLSQLPKLRMNFFGLHTYPEGGVGPEPAVWIGPAEDVGEDGRVKASYPSRHFTTLNGRWGYAPKKTSDYAFGSAALFERDAYGNEVMLGMAPWPPTPEAANEVFHRMGLLLREAFRHAHALGVKTCIGTETPLTVPKAVRARGRKSQKSPAAQALYEGMFLRIMRTYPVDYYWFWTPEGWTWGGAKKSQVDATVRDLQSAIAAAKKVEAPFTLATCGWVLGPPQDRALFDNLLPKQMPMSCISRQVGKAPVEPGFARVKGRPKWSIPWLEDDPALTSPQLWVGRMRKDAADSLQYGCTGLMGIHWRTRILGPNVAALAKAAWDQSPWSKAKAAAPKTPRKPGPVGGSVAAFPRNPIAETDDDPLYQTVRYDVSAYHMPLPNGAYTVVLKFCEPHYKAAGRRVFGAKLQGRKVIDRLDIFAKVGQNKALDYTFKDVRVTEGWLDIEFVHQVEFPCIAAIAVVGPSGSRKINCGGPKHKDYAADWPAAKRGPRPDRFLPTGDFYRDWALSQFGPGAARQAAELFERLDGHLPRPSDWVRGPGGLKPDKRPRSQVDKEYAFVDEMASLRPKVKGAGNLARFDYWLGNFRCMRATAQAKCLWAQLGAAMVKAKAQKTPDARKRVAREAALPVRKELVRRVAEVYAHLLATVSNPGEMGTVANWEQHILPSLLEKPGRELAKLLGEPLPDDATPSKRYSGPTRVVVPTLRTSLAAGEALKLKVIILAAKAPREAALVWRPMGPGKFARVPLSHVARGVYSAKLPPPTEDIEYYVEAVPDGGDPVRFPPTAPALNQTVVVVPAPR